MGLAKAGGKEEDGTQSMEEELNSLNETTTNSSNFKVFDLSGRLQFSNFRFPTDVDKLQKGTYLLNNGTNKFLYSK